MNIEQFAALKVGDKIAGMDSSPGEVVERAAYAWFGVDATTAKPGSSIPCRGRRGCTGARLNRHPSPTRSTVRMASRWTFSANSASR
jgi:hypothetical protein